MKAPSDSPTKAPTESPSDSPSASPTTDAPTTSPTSENPVNTASPSPNGPGPDPDPVTLKTIIDVNVDPTKSNGEIEEEMLAEVLEQLQGRRLGATVSLSLLEEQDDHDQRKLFAQKTIDVDDGTLKIVVTFVADILCAVMFGSNTPPPGNVCRQFVVDYFFTGVDEDEAIGLVAQVDQSVTDGIFTAELEFCTVLDVDTVDGGCNVVTTEAPTEFPTEVPGVTDSPTTDTPTTSPTSEKPATLAPTPSGSGGSGPPVAPPTSDTQPPSPEGSGGDGSGPPVM